ncbi:MAG: NTP transferase domain-containing protein [Gammaproteobacteria bacterium]|nr:NTP transferase domain-containing protein [Gammaproteobacteria bacterium]
MPEAAVPVLRGLVLAGGASRRLGSDKAALVHEGVTLLERAAGLLAGITVDVHVSVRQDQCGDPLRGRFALVVDERGDIGPAAGLLAAHRRWPSAAWLALACDMPWVTRALLGQLVAARDPGREATAFRSVSDGLPEPLCAIYEPATLARFRARLEAGADPSPRRWLQAADTVLIEAACAQSLGSVNTPDDLARLRS